VPAKAARPRSLAGYLDALSRAVFEAGISWKVVEAKWGNVREAFHGFDPAWVAALTPRQIDRLAGDAKIIRNRPKIEATVENARTVVDLDGTYRGFRRYLQSFADYDSLAADLHKRFRYIGPTGAYHFLWQVGEPVPDFEHWRAAR
jgi:3-methyladenine DNA glycosylase Tag